MRESGGCSVSVVSYHVRFCSRAADPFARPGALHASLSSPVEAEGLSVLVATRSLSHETYRSNQEQRDVVERCFNKLTEATLDIAETLVAFE